MPDRPAIHFSREPKRKGLIPILAPKRMRIVSHFDETVYEWEGFGIPRRAKGGA